ncbi:unnamed protein product [Alternaria alternata]
MSASVKFTGLLALTYAVAAVPHYQHNKFHHRAAHPTGGWGGAYNGAAETGATGTGVYGDDKTTPLDTTSTSTATEYSTIYVKPTGLAGDDDKGVEAADASTGTVTVTASEKVTVTVTPGGGAGVPTSSPVAAESSADNGYGVPSSAAEYPANTPTKAASSSAVETPVETQIAETKVLSRRWLPCSETPEASKPVAEASSDVLSAAPSPTAATGNSYSGVKRGLAYNEAHLCTTFGSKFGFGYNSGPTESNDIGTTFVPMMHSPSKSSAEEWLANVDKAVEKGSTAVMGFDECDHAEQCGMEPEAACAAWKTYMNPVKSAHPDVTIVGPDVADGQAPMGLNRLSRFNDCCPDAVVDATNIHFYDIYDEKTMDHFQAQVEKAASLSGKKVWITEFRLNPGSASEERAASFLKDAVAYLDGSDKVQGYSWFMVGDGENQLNYGNGLSAVRKVYAGAT